MDSHQFIISRIIIITLIITLISGCEAQSTPVPVADTPATSSAIDDASISTPSDDVTVTPPTHYGITPNSASLARLLPDDVKVTIDAMSNPTLYDIALTWGVVDGWDISPVNWQGIIILQTDSSQLSNPDLLRLIERIFDGDTLLTVQGINGTGLAVSTLDSISIRNTLANLGYPDGITLRLATDDLSPVSEIRDYLENLNIRTVTLPMTDDIETLLAAPRPFDLLFITIPSNNPIPEHDGLQMIPLYTIPISYLNNTDQTVSFNAAGLPVPADS